MAISAADKCKAIYCTLGTVFLLVWCSYGALDPLEYGIDFNYNNQELNLDRTFQGGRNYIGLYHRYVTFPARRMFLSFTNDPYLQYLSNGTYYGLVYTYEPVRCRTLDGLKLEVQATLTVKVGLHGNTGPPAEGEIPGGGEVVKLEQRESLEEFYLRFGSDQENWMDQIYVVALSAVEDEAAKWIASDFYAKREEIGKSMESRIRLTLLTLEVTLVDLQLVNVMYPTEFTVAIQETELAKQAYERAVFDQGKQVIEAVTRTEQAKVFVDMINYTAMRTAEVELLRKEVASEIIKYQIEAKGDGFAQARESFKGTSSDSSLRELASSLAKVDYSNDDLLTFVWLMALVDTNAKKLLLDSSQPFDLESLAGDLEGLELNHEKFLADAKRRLLEDVDIDEILQNVADLDRRSEL
jgi:hypothetical protein